MADGGSTQVFRQLFSSVQCDNGSASNAISAQIFKTLQKTISPRKNNLKKMIKQICTFSILTGLLLTSCINNKNNQENQKETKIAQTETIYNEELLVGKWVEPNPINEKEVQGIEILKGGNAKSINMATLVYSKWWTKNNEIFLVAESIGNGTSSIDTTAYEIIKVDKDSLVIKDEFATIRYKKQ